MGRAIGRMMILANSRRAIIASLFDEAPYYPKYDKSRRTINTGRRPKEKVTFNTILRIEKEGIWYCVHHIETGIITDEISEKHILNKFIHNIYLSQNFTKIDPSIKDSWGTPLFPKDELQISEKERLGLSNKSK